MRSGSPSPPVDEDLIGRNVGTLLETLPPHVTLVAAVKSRSPEEVEAAIRAGITCLGHNYLQEAERMLHTVGKDVEWHMIGHLQRNKARKAARVFSMIQTLDSWPLALALERCGKALGTVLPVLVETNSGREPSKTGVFPEDMEELVGRLSQLSHLRVQGLMTMGPRFGNPEDARPFFRATREAFDSLASLNSPNVVMRTLSMGMSNSYQVAIEEGANMIRIGSRLFEDMP